ncbi:TraB/GumN family protein [Ciceribacter sp. RN22]|uniref:TraB/GumN family protein n=1 Tax=Ciceribacter sp. RN22 TaxID=2954932 RepID=UPI002092A75C|nr:TraB/GumN family protein [Ciceribacter sp. RN22]MCO6180310.1 TraB/GumN family protein [Ciceribacter sp. RN22]
MFASLFNRNGSHHSLARMGDLVLWFLAALHVALALSLLLVLTSLSPARAESNSACPGIDLLSDLKQKDSGAYEAILREAAKTPNGKGIFWKIEKDGLAPSYLLGTMHVTDPRVLRMPKGAPEALAVSSTIVVESDEILDDKKAAAAILLRPDLTMFTDGTSITDHLSAEDATRLEAGLQQRGIPLATVLRMKPWIISSFVALPGCEVARKAKGASFLDKHIAEEAVKAGKPVVGLETFAEQLEAVSSLPVDFHLQALIETVALGDRMNDVVETMVRLYTTGEIGMTMPMLQKVAPGKTGDSDSGYAAFERRIVLDRNKTMAERAMPLLAKGGVFIAVGALHLPGNEGLVELLRKQGYSVTAVNG